MCVCVWFLCVLSLGEKAYRATINFNPEERPITWSQFCKEALPDRTFTFWDWFYAVMKLTRDQLRGPWTEGLIIGFINKRQAEEMLLKCAPGTFLLRFSDSELGEFITTIHSSLVTSHVCRRLSVFYVDYAFMFCNDGKIFTSNNQCYLFGYFLCIFFQAE